MHDAPFFNRITQRSYWLSVVVLVFVPISLILLGALFVGAQQFFHQERLHLVDDFEAVLGNLQEQERFLSHLHSVGGQLRAEDLSPVWRKLDVQGDRVFVARSSPAAIPFSLICRTRIEACDPRLAFYQSLGNYLSGVYSAFWSLSDFPSASLVLSSRRDPISLSIPSFGTLEDASDESRRAAFVATIRFAWKFLDEQDAGRTSERKGPDAGGPVVHWLPVPGQPHKLLALSSLALFPLDAPPLDHSRTVHLRAALLIDEARLHATRTGDDTPAGYRFWLGRAGQGDLIRGGDSPPDLGAEGFKLTANGLAFLVRDEAGLWTGRYLVSYDRFLRGNAWFLAGAGFLILLCLLGGVGYARWYRYGVVEPARKAQQEILEREAFNRTLIETAPVALCLLEMVEGRVVFSNASALAWLGLEPGDAFPELPGLRDVWRQVRDGQSAGIQPLALPDDRHLLMACAPTRYHEQDVLLCIFTDITAQVEAHHELERAKEAADAASAAKSTFLATMSHEIRTPLYGVLGSLELLSLMALDTQQHQQVERIRGASHQLLQIISDVLDITRIEAGQLQINREPFDPVALVEDCVAAYAAMAQQKGLLLFACVDPETPAAVMGDMAHIRQILNNLISNAVKFTQAGHVIVRLRAEPGEAGRCALRFQVADSGIGITREQQVDLFKPFYLVHADNHTVRGAGLGLSICDRLAQLMDSRIQVVSEPGLGSSFTFELTLDRVDGAAGREAPDLRTLSVRVRAPHAELAENLSRWLAHWGAAAQIVPAAQEPSGGSEEVLLDVQMPRADAPPGWQGRYMGLSPREGPSTHAGIDGFRVSSIGLGLGAWLGGGHPPAEDAAQTAAPRLAWSGVRILVVEDNPINMVTLRDQLEQLGCQVTVAENGEDALSLWAAGRYDVVLTDVNMPRMNGYELARHLRGLGEQIPIVGLTANAMRDEELRCRDSGMDAWVVKPIDLRTLCGLLNKLRPRDQLPPNNTPRPETAVRAPAEGGTEGAKPIEDRYRAVFRRTMAADLGQLRLACGQGQTEAAARLLHRMRGALVVVGWEGQARELGALEDALTAGADAPAVWEKVRQAQEALSAQVEQV